MLTTPSFLERTFRGEPMLHALGAEASACGKLLEDPEAPEAASKLPPPSKSVALEGGGSLLEKTCHGQVEERFQEGYVSRQSQTCSATGCARNYRNT